ncbi:MAG: hypothetical protein PHZ07_00600 [Patescibacteria group bacterium]|nr:hypothetical protein [Patescibacteria group bacterium]MDD4304220.1 hypothetical protein [Patescibacteria group bacterium]MDD4695253.1 hypothetical protein [Patescibacteria group bacterium]
MSNWLKNIYETSVAKNIIEAKNTRDYLRNNTNLEEVAGKKSIESLGDPNKVSKKLKRTWFWHDYGIAFYIPLFFSVLSFGFLIFYIKTYLAFIVSIVVFILAVIITVKIIYQKQKKYIKWYKSLSKEDIQKMLDMYPKNVKYEEKIIK